MIHAVQRTALNQMEGLKLTLYNWHWLLINHDFGADSIANKLRTRQINIFARCSNNSSKADKGIHARDWATVTEQFRLKNGQEHKQEFLVVTVNELEELLPLLMKDKLLHEGVSHCSSAHRSGHLRTHAAQRLACRRPGCMRGAGLEARTALNGVQRVSVKCLSRRRSSRTANPACRIVSAPRCNYM